MSKLLLDEKPLIILPNLASLIGLNKAIVIQQLHYWLNDNGKFIDGRKWIYNTYEDWGNQFPFWSDKTIRRTITELENDGLLITANYNKLKADRTKWYSIDYRKLDILTSPCGQNDQSMWSNWPVASGQNDPSNTRDYTETTSDIKTSCPKSMTYDDDSPYVKMAKYLQKNILRWKPDYVFRGSLNKWADCFRLIHERDKRSKEDIRVVIDWATSDSFWQANILSPDKLRKQFDTLQAQMRRPKIKSNELIMQQKKQNKFDREVQLNRWIESGGDPDEFVYKPNESQ